MNFPILEALPSLHVTIIGIVAAFFSAFAIYAYQKVNDAKDRLKSSIRHSISISTPNSILQVGGNKFLNDDETIDWAGVGRMALSRIATIYPCTDRDDGGSQFWFNQKGEPSPEEVISACEELFLLLSTIFTTYPFWNTNVEVSEETLEEYVAEFDHNRLQAMWKSVAYLNSTWDTHSRALMTLAMKGNEYMKHKNLQEQKRIFEENISKRQELKDPELQSIIWSKYHANHLENKVDYQLVFSNYFEKSNDIEKNIIPLLSASMSIFQTYNKTFLVKKTTMNVIRLMAFNIILGVLTPLIILKLFSCFSSEYNAYSFWFDFMEYCFLLITMYPYLWACSYLYKKVNDLKFS